MKKKLFLSALAVLFAVSMNSASYANDCPNVQEGKVVDMAKPPIECKVPPCKQIKPQRPSKAEMEAKKAEFEKRLNLTETQKQQIEKNKAKDREKMKPIMQKMHEKRKALRDIEMDKALSPEEKIEKSAPIEKDLIDLKVKANDLRKKNMESFEKLLNSEQKAEFEKIKQEQKDEMERRAPHFKGPREGHHPQPPIGMPVEPKPIPVER